MNSCITMLRFVQQTIESIIALGKSKRDKFLTKDGWRGGDEIPSKSEESEARIFGKEAQAHC